MDEQLQRIICLTRSNRCVIRCNRLTDAQRVQRIPHSPVGHARGIASESRGRWREKEKNSRENVWGTLKSGIYVLINVKQIAIAIQTTAVLCVLRLIGILTILR